MFESHTLGGKNKSFRWAYEDRALLIQKEINGRANYVKFSYEEILAILFFIDKKGPLPLANNVSQLHEGTEKEGVGWFVYNHFGNDISKAQSVSQLMPILVEVGLVEYDHKKRGMLFQVIGMDYLTSIDDRLSKKDSVENSIDPLNVLVNEDRYDWSRYKTIFERIEASLLKNSNYDEQTFREKYYSYKEFSGRIISITDDEFYEILVAVVFYSGFKAATVNKYHSKIKYYFHDYKQAMAYDNAIIGRIVSDDMMLSNRSKINACVKNAAAISQVVKEYGSVKAYIYSFGAKNFQDGLAPLIMNLRKRFSYLGEVTVFHLLTDLGFNVLKPDRVIMRILKRLKLVEDASDFMGAVNVGRKFADATGYPIRYIDIILVSYGQLDLENLTSICTESNPRCELCGVREYCCYQEH